MRRSRGAADSNLLRWLILLAVPLLVRFAVFFELSGAPFFETLFIDARTYHDMAVRIATGVPLTPGPHWQPPLYPYALSWLYRLTGPDVAAARIAQIFLGSASCVLLFELAERVAGRRVAWIAWGAMSFYGPFLFFDLQLLNVTLGTFLFLSFLVATLPLLDGEDGGRTFRAGAGSTRSFGALGSGGARISNTRGAGTARISHSIGVGAVRISRALGAGLLAGLGAITVGNMMLLAPVAAGWVWLQYRTRRAALVGLVLLSGAAIPIGVVTLWNLSASGEPVVVSYNGGVNFWIGNNPEYERTVAIRPGRAWIALTAEPREAGHLGYRAQSAYFFDKAWNWMKSDPPAALRLLVHKSRLFFRSDEILRNQQLYPLRDDSLILRILLWIHGIGFPFGLVLPLSAAGVAALTMDRFRYSRSGSEQRENHASHSRSGSESRENHASRSRSGSGSRENHASHSRSGSESRENYASHSPSGSESRENYASHSRSGSESRENHASHSRSGSKHARAHLRTSSESSGNAGLGFLLLVSGMYAASVIAFFVTARYRVPIVPILLIFTGVGVEALRAWVSGGRRLTILIAVLLMTGLIANLGLPSMPMEFNSDAYSDLGYTYQVNGDRVSARREYERALELDPRNFEARNNLAGLLSEAGEWTSAVLQLRAILEAYPDDQKVLANLGRIFLTMGRPYDAGATFDRLARVDPDDPIAASGLTAAHEMADRVEADEIAANPVRFLETVRTAAAASPQDRFLQSRLRGLTSSDAR